MSSKKHKRTLPKADSGQHHTSKMQLKIFFTKSLILYNVNKKSFRFI